MPSIVTALRHHWPLVPLCLLLMVGLAVAYTATQATRYTAEAVVLLNPVPGNSLSPEAASTSGAQVAIAMETESGIVSTPAVAQAASEGLGHLAPAQGERLAASVPAGTQMIGLLFTSSSPTEASRGAQAFAEAFLEYRETRAEESQSLRLENLQQQADTADENLRRATAEAAEQGSDSYASQEVQLYADRLAQLNDSISAAEAMSTDPGRVINPAEPPESADGIPAVAIVAGAGLVGAVAGVILALLREWRRDLVREDEEFDVRGVPVFARLPARVTVGLAVTGGGQPAAHEAYRRLRAGVVANGPRPHVLAVSRVGGRSEASLVSSNLAVVLSQAGFSVLLVAANPHTSRVEEVFGIAREPGLAEVIRERVDLGAALVQTSGVAVLPGGRDPLGVREHYAGPEFRRVIDEQRDEFDYIVIDAAATGTSDGDAVIAAADSVLLALTTSRTTHAQVGAALDRFARLDIQAIGAVNVPVPKSDRSVGSGELTSHKQARRQRESVDAGR